MQAIARVMRQNAANLERLMHRIIGNIGKDTLNYLKPQTHLIKGTPHGEVPALIARIEVDPLIMGTVARTGVPGFIAGNTAETILNPIDCSVPAIKMPGSVTSETLPRRQDIGQIMKSA